MTKRIFSILLALCMVFAFMPASAFAADSDITLAVVNEDGTPINGNLQAGDKVKVIVNLPAFKDTVGIEIGYDVNKDAFEIPNFEELGTSTFTYNGYSGLRSYRESSGCMKFTITNTGGAAFDVEKGTLEVVFTVKNAPGAYNFAINDETEVTDVSGKNMATINEATSKVTVTVAKAKETLTADDFNITVPTDTVYGGSTVPVAKPTIKDSSKNIGDVTVKYNGTTEEPKVAGTYHVTFDVEGTEDYNAAKDLEIGTFKITQKDLTLKATAKTRAYEEGNTSVTLENPTLEGVVGNDDVAFDTANYTATVADADAGNGKAVTVSKYGLTGEQAGNYQLLPPTGITVDIEKAGFTGTKTHTEKATKGSSVECNLVTEKELSLPAGATFAKGTVTDTDSILDGDVAVSKDGKLTFKFKADAATGKTATIPVTVTSKNYKDFTITITAEVKDASTGGGGGGIIIPPTVQKPEIKLVEATMGKAELSADGTTATITPNDGYEIDKVTVNEKEVAFTGNKVTGLKTGDKVVVTFKEKAAPEPAFDVQKYVSDLKLVARSTKTAKGNVKVTVKTVTDQNGTAVNLSDLKDKGYTVKYKFYRSNKKASKYAAKVEKTIDKNSYVNTTGKNGTKYFYKVRVMVYDNDGKLVAKSELKQCKYASRTWTKK